MPGTSLAQPGSPFPGLAWLFPQNQRGEVQGPATWELRGGWGSWGTRTLLYGVPGASPHIMLECTLTGSGTPGPATHVRGAGLTGDCGCLEQEQGL